MRVYKGETRCITCLPTFYLNSSKDWIDCYDIRHHAEYQNHIRPTAYLRPNACLDVRYPASFFCQISVILPDIKYNILLLPDIRLSTKAGYPENLISGPSLFNSQKAAAEAILQYNVKSSPFRQTECTLKYPAQSLLFSYEYLMQFKLD